VNDAGSLVGLAAAVGAVLALALADADSAEVDTVMVGAAALVVAPAVPAGVALHATMSSPIRLAASWLSLPRGRAMPS
jgi:hypothetical protein